jgi:acyl dehydratase
MNPQVEGKVYPAVEFRTDPDRVRRFARAVGAPEGLGLPPTFATVAEFESLPRIAGDPAVGLDYGRVVHGEQEYEWRRPLVAGETLWATPRIASIRSKGGHGFLTVETELRDAAGEVVVLARATLVERGSA